MEWAVLVISMLDHCRIGSLENGRLGAKVYGFDHCRIGSLEIYCIHDGSALEDHCRIGIT